MACTCNWTVCGICNSLEIAKPSVVWCSECDEGICAECDKHHAVSKASRVHSTIPITKYYKLPTDILKIAHTCSKHNEKFQTYCKKHDCPCCRRCVIETHNSCKDITAIDDIIKGVKSSNALYDIELMLVGVAENLENITKDRKDNLISLKDQKRRIENEIQQTRIRINSHLDQIQEELMKKLNALEEKERKKIEVLMTSLEEKIKDINEYKTTLSNIKQHASELQTFLYIKQMENKVTAEGRSLETLACSDSIKQIFLSLKDEGAFQTISNLKYIGQIEVEIRPSKVMMTTIKGKQAQLEVVHTSPRLTEDIEFNLKQTIETGLSLTTGCLILPDGGFALSCRKNNLVRFFNKDGDKDFEIILEPDHVIDITFIAEDNTVAATSGMEDIHNINVINIKDKKISKKIGVESFYYGVVYKDFTFITLVKDKGLHILKSGNGEIIDEFIIPNMSSYSYVATFNNKLYYTNRKEHTVTCCDIKGIEIWTFKDENVLVNPRGITVDNDGNVYVVNDFNCTIIVISPDGKRFLRGLCKKNGLTNPRVLDFDRSTNQLLVANQQNNALIFQVSIKN